MLRSKYDINVIALQQSYDMNNNLHFSSMSISQCQLITNSATKFRPFIPLMQSATTNMELDALVRKLLVLTRSRRFQSY